MSGFPSAGRLGDQGEDDRGEGRDDGGERTADDEGHGNLHEVAAHDEVLEALEHRFSFGRSC
jgi:hypothetical protein